MGEAPNWLVVTRFTPGPHDDPAVHGPWTYNDAFHKAQSILTGSYVYGASFRSVILPISRIASVEVMKQEEWKAECGE